ncbi:unnamed protein product [Nippostrongylus brasiliensis]|uniref:GRAM domain-containing protein n=1 Tax=Nippostrongylus brasiliensis TaxID=27835 RepID=A0A0N4YEE7_NIPBR|nr:unnamed protein product [Nippostrongylus brasiliensis]
MMGVRLKRPRHLRGMRRQVQSEDEDGGSVDDRRLRKTISSDHLLHEALDSPDYPPATPPGSVSSNSSCDKKSENPLTPSRALAKKKKYFAERTSNKNIFKKLIHPSYQERAGQYRRLFGSKVGPEPDEFLASFSCAYQREILCQGRMYISQRHICFYANIFGWETNLVVPLADIEMKDESRHFFASFVNREKSMTVLQKVLEKTEAGELMTPEELWECMNINYEEKPSLFAEKKVKEFAQRLLVGFPII